MVWVRAEMRVSIGARSLDILKKLKFTTYRTINILANHDAHIFFEPAHGNFGTWKLKRIKSFL